MLKLAFHNESVLLNSVFPYGNFRAGNEAADFGFLGREEKFGASGAFWFSLTVLRSWRGFLYMSASGPKS